MVPHKTLMTLLIAVSILITGCGGSSETGGNFDPTEAAFLNLNELNPDARSLGATESDWYKDAIFYHVWMSAFSDGPDTDTEGDIPGIIAKLDYLQNDLGVTAIWLSPFLPSASGAANRHNYDATDHYSVNSVYGSTDDLNDLIEQVHSRGMRIILDWVPNHVSSQHPWFIESASSTTSLKRDWFIWRSSRPGGWTGWDADSDFHPDSGSYFYGVFWSGMPDLNYRNQEVRDAMGNGIIHWLNAGFDGIRVDAVKYLYEDWNTNGAGYSDQPLTFSHYEFIRSDILDRYSNVSGSGGNLHKFMVAENWTGDRANLLKYMDTGSAPAFHMTLDFPFAYAAASLNAGELDSHWKWVKQSVEPVGGWMGPFTSNHDNVISRPMSNFNGDAAKVRAQAALLLTGVGTPYLYYGNEIGMTGIAGNDANLRTPLDWTEVTAQKADGQSLLSWHKALTALRRERISLRRGSYSLIQNSGGIFAFERAHESERTLVVFNLSGTTKSPALTLGTTPGATVTRLGSNALSSSGKTVTLNNMTGYAVRVIALEAGATGTTPFNDIPYVAPPYQVYLRGTFVSGGWNPGSLTAESGGIHSISIAIPSTGVKEFKFFDGSTWFGFANTTYDAALGGDAGFSFSGPDNITFTASVTGTYTFYFKPANSTFSVDAP